MDQPDILSLANPDQHTIHCLIDPPPCLNSPFEVLTPPQEGQTNWTRAYTLDERSKGFVVNIIKVVGVCNTCSNTGSLEAGFSARMAGTVVAMANPATGAGPVISLQFAEPILPEPEEMGNSMVGDTFR